MPSYSIPTEEITAHVLKVIPPTHYPDVFDVMMMVGGISGGVLLFLLAARMTPIMSIWEMAEGIRLRTVKPFLKREVVVLGKPE
ncbi:hypothetical protein M1N24_00535 [Dehalococcoidia bacterium]|nr:hypothetical protein [Dehalococcoidia bacterium]